MAIIFARWKSRWVTSNFTLQGTKSGISFPTEGKPAAASRSLETQKLKALHMSEDRMQGWLKVVFPENQIPLWLMGVGLRFLGYH